VTTKTVRQLGSRECSLEQDPNKDDDDTNKITSTSIQ